MPFDPFLLKSQPKYHPVRVILTGWFRMTDYASKAIYPIIRINGWSTSLNADYDYNQDNTAVTPEQMGVLCAAVRELGEDVPGDVVEIGSYRGVTTRKLAENTNRTVYAIDPFEGYGGAENDAKIFRSSTVDLPNVVNLKTTSGEAVRSWLNGAISFVFIDAVHDYQNTMFDAQSWEDRLSKGGILAMHDVDNPRYAGTHLAAWRMSRKLKIAYRVTGLLVLRKISD